MKKLSLSILSLVAILAMTGCGGGSSAPTSTVDPTTSTDPTSTVDPTTVVDPTTAEDPTTVVDPTTAEDPTNVDPTTGSPIDPRFEKIHDYLYATHLPGQYDGEIDVEFYVPTGYKLLYSLDCEEPTTPYTGKITLKELPTTRKDQIPLTTSVDGILEWAGSDKCYSGIYVDNIQKPGNYQYFDRINVITVKVVSVSDPNDVVLDRALSYMISDYNHTIPIISLSMPYDKWFGEEEGFYNQIRSDIEHRCNLEYWDNKHDEYFFRNTQIKLGGNWTLGYPMRTLNLNFNKDQYGEKNDKVKENVFDDRQTRDGSGRIEGLRRFRLWSGGNTFESGVGYNDAVLQQLMEKDTNCATAGWRPCVVYANGEYWGMYYLREHYKDVYFELNYGVDKDEVIFAELKGELMMDDGDEEIGEQLIAELEDFYTTYDFSSDINYNTFVAKYIDIDSFIDVFIAEYYSSNWDFVGNNNNLKMWRTINVDEDNPYADGKWRFVLHDIDFAFTENKDYMNPHEQHCYQRWPMFNNLLKNDKFKNKFYERAEELMETNFSYDVAESIVTGMMNKVKPYKKDAMKRWGKIDSNKEYIYWINENQNILNYIEEKETTFLPMLHGRLFDE